VATYSLFSHAGTPAISGTPSGSTLGTEFSLSAPAALTGIWYFTPTGATGLPGNCVIYKVSDKSQVAGTLVNSPTWSGAAGANQWVKCSYDGSVILAAATNYRVAVFAGASAAWAYQGGYWASPGPGQNGITSGIITAPNAATASDGGAQGSVSTAGSLAYPNNAADSPSNFWIDVEVTVGSALLAALLP
jgi:hypothetical protein